MYKLGIDIGNSTFKYIYMNEADEVIEKGYLFHKGEIEKYYNALVKKVQSIAEGKEIALGIVGALSSRLQVFQELLEDVVFSLKQI